MVNDIVHMGPAETDLAEWLLAVLRESLRVTPSIGEFIVTCDKDEIIGDGKYLIPKGSIVNLLIKSIGTDPAVWGEDVSYYMRYPKAHSNNL